MSCVLINALSDTLGADKKLYNKIQPNIYSLDSNEHWL